MKRFWLVAGGVGAVMAIAIATALAAPHPLGQAVDKIVQLVFALAALVAYARKGDRWMTAAMASLTIALSAWIWGQQVLGVQLPSTTIAPLGFTLVPVLTLAAVIARAQAVRRTDDLLPNYRSRTVVVLDGMIVIGSLFVLTWVSALESLTRAWATEGPGFATVVAHPAAYLVLLVAIVVLSWTHRSVRQWPMLFVAGAGIAQSSSGWVFAFYISKGITAIPAAADTGFMLCPALFFLSALAPSSDYRHPTPGRVRMGDLLHLLVPYLPLAITGLFILWNTATGGSLNPVEIYVGLAVVCLVIVRQLLTMMDNVRLMDQLRISREQLKHEASHDPLTGVANRSLFRERLDRALSNPKRTQPLTLLFIDVDGFKAVNDNYGHAEGDAVLRNVAARLNNNVRPEDTVARLGGDEFGVLIDGEADEVGERLLTALSHPHEVNGRTHHVHASIGVAQQVSYDPTYTADAMLGSADAAMYTAKRLGKGMVVVHGSPLPEMT